ncbi:MAG: hypothetical protein LBJ37_05545 [Paucimonas sp.]|jgi:predicted N-acetyltransferase YhbS|nr:hypothetical protein [Paucimonas sp.]
MSKLTYVTLKRPVGATLCSALPHNQSGIPLALRALGTARTSVLTFAKDGSELWVMLGPLSAYVDLACLKPFSITVLRPAKGPGLFAMQASAMGPQHEHCTLLDFGRYSEGADEEIAMFAQELQQVLGYVPARQDWGYDC